MKQQFFTNLPSDIIIDILTRLPIPAIARCKSVCKAWLDLLETPHFINLHLSKSDPGLAVFHQERTSPFYEIYQFEDELDLDHHDLHYTPLTTFKLPFDGLIQGSANGLLLLRDLLLRPNGLSVCNPITREHVAIHTPQELDYRYPQVATFGFGASRMSGQHKVVRVFHDCILDQDTYKVLGIPKSECHVYTLGAGSWRSVAPSPPLVYSCRSIGAFLNGNLHWFVLDSDEKPMISCFDLETEMFLRAFSVPRADHRGRGLVDVFALGDYLCVCDKSGDDEIVIWLMKEYGNEKSWMKEFVIKTGGLFGESYDIVRPIKVFKDGDILMAWGDSFLFYASSKSRTATEIKMFEARSRGAVDSILHTSSFISLWSLGMENVDYF